MNRRASPRSPRLALQGLQPTRRTWLSIRVDLVPILSPGDPWRLARLAGDAKLYVV